MDSIEGESNRELIPESSLGINQELSRGEHKGKMQGEILARVCEINHKPFWLYANKHTPAP